jgi:hypothetical protein
MGPRKRSGSPEVMYGSPDEFVVEDVQDGWHLQAWIEVREGAPRITELRLRSSEGTTLYSNHGPTGPESDYKHKSGRRVPQGGITTAVLRSLSLTALHDAIGKVNASASFLTMHGIDPDKAFHAQRRPGRRGREDSFYALWAKRYLDRCATTRRPYAELAKEHKGYAERSIRDIVQTAKRRGLLVGGSQGRAGGRLSAKAERLLARMSDAATTEESTS